MFTTRSAARHQPDAFPAIHDLCFLSNRKAMALLGKNGNVEFFCLPRPDSDSVFGALLDRDAGRFQIAPGGGHGHVVEAGYEPRTMTMSTSWETPTGAFVVRDTLATRGVNQPRADAVSTPFQADSVLIRTILCVRGLVNVEAVCDPRPGFGLDNVNWRLEKGGARADGLVELRLTTDLDLHLIKQGAALRGTCDLRAGEGRFVALAWEDGSAPSSYGEAVRRLDATGLGWQRWLKQGVIPAHPLSRGLERSALTLEGMRYEPTGAIIAAPTTSLPEVLGGSRNWDYRYTWWRDAAMQTVALARLGFREALSGYMDFLVASISVEDIPNDLLCMVRIDGSRDLAEHILDHMSGYGAHSDRWNGAQPVRTGNGAAHQRQNDVPGMILDAIYNHVAGGGVMNDRLWVLAKALVEGALSRWEMPDEGIWEIRGEARHFVSSKVMSWVAVDRGAKLASDRGEPVLTARWRALADAIHDDVCRRGVNREGIFTQYYGSGNELDASALLIPIMGFLDSNDPRVRATALAIAAELSDGAVVRRYRVATDVDGLGGQDEGGFILCSFWLVEALTCIDEGAEAHSLFVDLLDKIGAFGLYAEEIDHRTGAGLGNMPQGYSHIGLIHATLRLINDAAHLVGSPALHSAEPTEDVTTAV